MKCQACEEGDHQNCGMQTWCECDCDGPEGVYFEPPDIFMHITPKADACDHDFQGWRDFPDGRGGERVCTKCGIGAMAHTLSLDF